MDNIKPGKRAPIPGQYACSYCGPGGLAELTFAPMRNMRARREAGGQDVLLRDADITTPVSKRVTLFTTRMDGRLPECPTCGPATGWDVVHGSVYDYLEQRIQDREFLFDTMSIGRVESGADRMVVPDGLIIIKAPPGRPRRWWWPFGRRRR